jgi:tetratricopeptide (TPR) repeat protein
MTDDALSRYKEASGLGDTRATIATARLYLELGDLANARQWAQKASAGPASRDAEQLLIVMDAREGNVDRALQRATKLNGDAAPATLAVIKGDLLQLAGKTDAAIASYEDAQRKQPTAQNAVRIFNAQRRAKTAEPERGLREWLQRSPGDTDIRRTLAAYYEQTGDQARAIAEYETIVKAPEVDPFSLNNLAWLLHSRGDERALALAKRAHDAAPQYAEIADTYGWILVRMDRVADGRDVLKGALTNAPDNPDIQYHLAYAYAKTGERAQAAEMLKKALDSKSFASRTEAEELLRTVSGPGV